MCAWVPSKAQWMHATADAPKNVAEQSTTAYARRHLPADSIHSHWPPVDSIVLIKRPAKASIVHPSIHPLACWGAQQQFVRRAVSRS